MSDKQYVSKMENEFNQLIYECFYTAKLPRDSDWFRKMYLAYDKIDARSFDGIGKVKY